MKISDYLDAHPEILQYVQEQFHPELKNVNTGRPGLTAEQALRSLILMRIKNWDYRELAERIDDGHTLRVFARFYSSSVPQHSAFHRAFNRMTARVIERVNDLILKAAINDGIEDGAMFRSDTMVVETNIHWPTDGTLLWDTVRVVTRLLGKLRKAAPHVLPKFSNNSKAARRLMQKLQRMTATQRERVRLFWMHA
jgi:IS5 family transposase